MKAKTKHLAITMSCLVGAFGIIGFLAKGLTLNPNAIHSPLVGKPAQKFQVPLIQPGVWGEKNQIALENLKGKPFILNFWASWCTSCRAESKAIEAFWQENKQDVHILGIAVHDEADSAKMFAERFGKTYPIGLDESGDASLNYGVTGVPETIFVDKHGIVRHKESGPVTLSMLQSYWKKIKG